MARRLTSIDFPTPRLGRTWSADAAHNSINTKQRGTIHTISRERRTPVPVVFLAA
jgi:hypothetical protein